MHPFVRREHCPEDLEDNIRMLLIAVYKYAIQNPLQRFSLHKHRDWAVIIRSIGTKANALSDCLTKVRYLHFHAGVGLGQDRVVVLVMEWVVDHDIMDL